MSGRKQSKGKRMVNLGVNVFGVPYLDGKGGGIFFWREPFSWREGRGINLRREKKKCLFLVGRDGMG